MDLIIKRLNNQKLLIFFLMFEFVFSNQESVDNLNSYESGASLQKYSKNLDGSIMISLNIWGRVLSPGRIAVPDGADLITILSIVGGPIDGANLSKVKIIRESQYSSEIFIINLFKYLNSGDKSDFIKIMPNDTIIFPETVYSSVFKRLNNITSILSLFSLYVAITNKS